MNKTTAQITDDVIRILTAMRASWTDPTERWERDGVMTVGCHFSTDRMFYLEWSGTDNPRFVPGVTVCVTEPVTQDLIGWDWRKEGTDYVKVCPDAVTLVEQVALLKDGCIHP